MLADWVFGITTTEILWNEIRITNFLDIRMRRCFLSYDLIVGHWLHVILSPEMK